QTTSEWLAQHESTPVVWRRLRAGHVASDAAHHDQCGTALRVYVRAGGYLAELEQPAATERKVDGLYRRAERNASRADVPEQTEFRAAFGSSASLQQGGAGGSR